MVVVWLTGYILAYIAGTPQPTELSGLMALVLGWATAGEVRDTIIGRRKAAKSEDTE